MLATLILVEFQKLKRSLVVLLALTAPLMVPTLLAVMATRWPEAGQWVMFQTSCIAMWALFMLPMSTTALTALLGQVEHAPRAWSHVFALPVSKSLVIVAKLIVAIGVLAAMSALLLVWSLVAGSAIVVLAPAQPLQGAPDLAIASRLLGLALLAAMPMIAIQMWTALRFRNFIAPIALGILGTFLGVAASAAKEGVMIPWMMPINVLATDPARVNAVAFGGPIVGLILMAAAVAHLSRREYA